MSRTPIYGRLLADDGVAVEMAFTCPECMDESTATAKHGELLMFACDCGQLLEIQL